MNIYSTGIYRHRQRGAGLWGSLGKHHLGLASQCLWFGEGGESSLMWGHGVGASSLVSAKGVHAGVLGEGSFLEPSSLSFGGLTKQEGNPCLPQWGLR